MAGTTRERTLGCKHYFKTSSVTSWLPADESVASQLPADEFKTRSSDFSTYIKGINMCRMTRDKDLETQIRAVNLRLLL